MGSGASSRGTRANNNVGSASTAISFADLQSTVHRFPEEDFARWSDALRISGQARTLESALARHVDDLDDIEQQLLN